MLEREEAGSSLIFSVPPVNVLGFQKSESKNPPQRQTKPQFSFPACPTPAHVERRQNNKIEDPSGERIRVDFEANFSKNKQTR